MAQNVVILTAEEQKLASRRLQDQSYPRLIGAAVGLALLTLVPDCVPFIDEAFFVALNGAVLVALGRKVLRDLGLL